MSTLGNRSEIPKVYDPHQVEERRYRWWEEQGYFEATIADDGRPRYCIAIPPPNITGSLHMGHALCYSIHDLIIRWKRMKNYNVLCIPGTDHAGIATQNVVERELRQEGLSRWKLGREKFLQRVWQWREQYGNLILHQFRRLGCSFDWRYTRFTLDPSYADAVLETFVRWWQDGHLYIGERVINWCPGCRTALSDIEVETEEEPAKLYYIRYPFAEGEGYVVVATSRPETMLGDVAVAVNPEDERYRSLVGKQLSLPLVGRLIPLIADPYPDPAFGTGAVKVTPAHDHNDFEIAQRHGLPKPIIMHPDATMNTLLLREELNAHENPYLQAYHGKDRYEVRKMILADLEAGGYLEKVEDYQLLLGRCERCSTVIEPLLSEQWFARMEQIAEPAIRAVQEGKIRFIPERYAEVYLRWMENIRDWCISRQLWWGHQILAWYCVDCHPENFESESGSRLDSERELPASTLRIKRRQDPIVQKEPPTKCPRCGSTNLVRDPDVLDTWFSSAIWPHAVLGWPHQTSELRLFYPTHLLITAQEILYLWVARMIMTGLYFVGEVPFHEVYIYATVLNKEGKRMSKSLGTGVDPLEMIDRYGADALRWSILQQVGWQQSFRFSEERVVNGRNFANKIWNASRFVLMNLDDEFWSSSQALNTQPLPAELLDRWILSRLTRTIQRVNESMEAYRLDEAANALYEFIWSEFCDWYLEAVKPRLQQPAQRRATQTRLVYLLDHLLRLLHPYMPHLTEEIWQALPHEGETLMLASYPQADPSLLDEEAEVVMETVFQTIRAIRNLRAEVKITPGILLGEIYLHVDEPRVAQQLREQEPLVRSLAWFERVHWGKPPAELQTLADAIGSVEIFLPIKGVIDIEKECERLYKEISRTEEDLRRVQAKLRNPQFLERANPEVVQRERELESELLARHARLSERLNQLKGEG